MEEKTKEELSEIANKSVTTRRKNDRARDLLFPLLDFIKDGKEYHINDIDQPLGKKLNYSQEELEDTIPSGQKRMLYRLGWSKWFLKKANLITRIKGGTFTISPFGLEFLQTHPNFTWKEFEKLPGWQKQLKSKKEKKQKENYTELLSDQFSEQKDVKIELLEKIKEGSPYFFEKLMADMLEKMGYGVGFATQKSHDGGIDGIVTADKLGLSEIYIQTKRYAGAVPISHIKEFIGTIQTTKTKTGVFITSGTLPDNANQFILKSGLNIQLIDGEKLSNLMYDYDIGVKIKKVEPIKYIDEAFFVEEGLS